MLPGDQGGICRCSTQVFRQIIILPRSKATPQCPICGLEAFRIWSAATYLQHGDVFLASRTGQSSITRLICLVAASFLCVQRKRMHLGLHEATAASTQSASRCTCTRPSVNVAISVCQVSQSSPHASDSRTGQLHNLITHYGDIQSTTKVMQPVIARSTMLCKHITTTH